MLVFNRSSNIIVKVSTVNSRNNEVPGTAILLHYKRSFVITKVISIDLLQADQEPLRYNRIIVLSDLFITGVHCMRNIVVISIHSGLKSSSVFRKSTLLFSIPK